MRKLTPINDYPDFVKDEKTGMILNINNDKILQSQKIREQRIKDREDIEALKNDVQEIKKMLLKLIENN